MATIDAHGNHHHGKGTAGAGRFAVKGNSAPSGNLVSHTTTAADDTVTLPVTVAWIEPNALPTPRHRKPRPVERLLDTTVTIDNLTSENAPVGITIDSEDAGNFPELRVHNGELFRPVGKETTPATLLSAAAYLPSYREDQAPVIDGSTEEAVTNNLRERASEYISIDGELWQRTSEPVYTVMTFGLGGNHGSTALTITTLASIHSAQDEKHTAPESVFPANQRDEAIEYARQVARERGDTNSIRRMGDNTGHINATDAFLPGSTFTPAPRLNYTPPYEAIYGNGSPAHVRAEFDRFKAELLTVPGAVVDVDDGWGGTTKTVDVRKLSEKQARDYRQYLEYTSTMTH